MKVKLSEVCDIVKGKTTITKAIKGKFPLVVTAENRLSSNEYEFDCKAVCVPLVSATGHGHASIKRIHYQEGKFALGTILAAVIPKSEEELNARYLHIYLSYLKDSVIVPLMRGSANVSLTIKSLGSAEIELPDIEEQLKIVEMISLMENKKESLDKYLKNQNDIVLNMKKEILQLAVQGKLVPQNPEDEPASVLLRKIQEEKKRLIEEKKIKKEKPLAQISEEEKTYELPKGWEWVRMNSVIDVRDGTHDSPTYISNGGYPLVTGKDFYGGKLNFSKTKYISKDDYESIISRSKVDIGDILYSMIGGNIGSMVLIEEELKIAIKNVALFKRYADNTFLPQYLMFYLKSSVERMKAKAKGGAQPFVSLSILRNEVFPLPPLAEQKRIVEKVDLLMQLCDELEKKIEKSKKYSEKLMESILKSSFLA